MLEDLDCLPTPGEELDFSDVSPENVELVKRFLFHLDLKYSDEIVNVDTSTFNPARIVKLCGMRARKGEDTEERPHRRLSQILNAPDRLQCVTREQLRELADKFPAVDTSQKKRSKNRNAKSFDVRSWLEQNGLEIRKCSAVPEQRGKVRP